MNEQQLQQINNLLKRSELTEMEQGLMREFLSTISDEPQFEKIISLLERFPSLFENFCKCFQLKKDFLKAGKSEGEWEELLEKEKDILD